jgi:hypothetical protein
VKRPSKKEIAEAVAKLKANPNKPSSSYEVNQAKLTDKHSSQRIRKQGI